MGHAAPAVATPEHQQGSGQQDAGCQACGKGAVAREQRSRRERVAPTDAGGDPAAHAELRI